jgi:hypothetical protein
MGVNAVVVRAMIESSGRNMNLLGVDDGEFAYLESVLQPAQVRFNYRQAKSGDFEKGDTIITVSVINVTSVKAIATGTYSSKDGFVEFEFTLRPSGRTWEIVDKRLLTAS